MGKRYKVDRKRCHPVQDPTAPAIQPLTGGRCRVDPSIVNDLAAWLIVLRDRYERMAHMTLTGLTGLARQQRQGQIAHAKVALSVYDGVLRALTETIDMGTFERCRLAIGKALTQAQEESDEWLSMQDKLQHSPGAQST